MRSTAPFFPAGGAAEHGEIGMCQHRQGDVAMPAGPRAHLVLVQPNLALGCFKTRFDGPARACHPDQIGQAGRLGRQRQIKGEYLGMRQLAADQQPLAPAARGIQPITGQVSPVVR